MMTRFLLAAAGNRWRMVALLATLLAGCGTTTANSLTDQLLVSDAVDRAVAQISFQPLAGEKVYLDTRYLVAVKDIGFVNINYITSSLRQQLVAANCLLQENQDDADYVVEPRLGALGTDGHEITYGLPANNALNSAAHLIPNTPVVPTIPEIALAKRNDKVGAAKLAVYAYDNKTKERIWQSGISLAVSRKRDFWVMGAGPFQRGTIYDGTKFAGSDLAVPFADGQDEDPAAGLNVVFSDEKYFGKARKGQAESQEVDFEEIVPLEDPAPDAGVGLQSGDSPLGTVEGVP